MQKKDLYVKIVIKYERKINAIPKNSKNIEEAVKFLMYQVSKENQLLIAKMGDGIPSRKSIGVSNEFLYDHEFPNEKNNKIYRDEMKYARSPEYTPYADSTQVDISVSFGIE